MKMASSRGFLHWFIFRLMFILCRRLFNQCSLYFGIFLEHGKEGVVVVSVTFADDKHVSDSHYESPWVTADRRASRRSKADRMRVSLVDEMG